MNQGWARIHRQIEDSKLWLTEPFTRGQAWVDLVLFANHKPGIVNIRGNIITVKRGQIAWSELTMTQRWQWSRNKVRRFLKWLETEQQTTQQKVHKITTITTIVNYDKYQKGTTDDTTEGQQKDNRRYTNKNDKNDKNTMAAVAAKKVPFNGDPRVLLTDKQEHVRIIGYYAVAKRQATFATPTERNNYIARLARAARLLTGNEERVKAVLRWAIKNENLIRFAWTLETVGKWLNQDLNQLTEKYARDKRD